MQDYDSSGVFISFCDFLRKYRLINRVHLGKEFFNLFFKFFIHSFNFFHHHLSPPCLLPPPTSPAISTLLSMSMSPLSLSLFLCKGFEHQPNLRPIRSLFLSAFFSFLRKIAGIFIGSISSYLSMELLMGAKFDSDY